MSALVDAPRPGSVPQAERPVDLVHLSRVTFGNRELEREVLELFQTQSRLCLERLTEASGPQAWREAAHSLKGSARALGARQVVAAAEAAEALPNIDRGAGRAQILARVERHVADANAFIQMLLADA